MNPSQMRGSINEVVPKWWLDLHSNSFPIDNSCVINE